MDMKEPMKTKMIRNGRKALGFIAFMIVLLFVFCHLTYLFRHTTGDRIRVMSFKEEARDSLDMIYVGGSAAFVYWQPFKAWHDCGFTSYLLATNSMQAENTRAYIELARQRQKPSLFVIDARPFQYYSDAPHESGLRAATDNMDLLTLPRYHLLNDYFSHRDVPENTDILSYYFDIALYHNRKDAFGLEESWEHINNTGHTPDHGLEWFATYDFQSRPMGFPTDERTQLSENCRDILEDLLEYCRRDNLNVLFVVCPYVISRSEQMIYNSIKDIVEEYGFQFLNCNEYYDEIGINFGTDLYNVNHTNVTGAKLYTEFLERYIMEHYDMPDHRGNEAYVMWDQDYERCIQKQRDCQGTVLKQVVNVLDGKQILRTMNRTTDFESWYRLANDERFTFLVTGNQLGRFPTDAVSRQLLKTMDIVEGDTRIVRELKGMQLSYSNRSDGALQKTGGLGYYYYAAGIDENGACWVNANGVIHTLDGEGLNVTILDNNYRIVCGQVLITCNDEGRMVVRDMSEQCQDIVPASYGLTGTRIALDDPEKIRMSSSQLVPDQYDGLDGILCTGTLQRGEGPDDPSADEYLWNIGYNGFSFVVDDVTPHRFLSFYGKKIRDHGEPLIYAYDESGKPIIGFNLYWPNLDTEWHRYTLNLMDAKGKLTFIFNGGYIDASGNPESQYVFSNLELY